MESHSQSIWSANPALRLESRGRFTPTWKRKDLHETIALQPRPGPKTRALAGRPNFIASVSAFVIDARHLSPAQPLPLALREESDAGVTASGDSRSVDGHVAEW
jgi:hypothetical protein